jgi:hypothetical protein
MYFLIERTKLNLIMPQSEGFSISSLRLEAILLCREEAGGCVMKYVRTDSSPTRRLNDRCLQSKETDEEKRQKAQR